MKILFSDATLLHGGAERVISILANNLVEQGHEVEILLYYNRPIWYELDERIKVYNDESFIGEKKSALRHIVFRNAYFKKTNANVIISFLAPINMINILSMIGVNKKLIVADRNDPRKTPVNKLLRLGRNFLYNFADGIVLQSKNNKAYFSRTVQKKSTIIFNPVDVGEYKSQGIVSEKQDYIVAVGRIIRQKNPLLLVRSFADISKKFPNLNLIWYGEGDMRSEIESEVELLGLKDRISFPGAVQDVFEKIKNAKLYVMTSEFEGMPNALIEAMCVGIPVVSTKVSGAVDLIEDGVNGRLVECNNQKQLTEVLTALLSNYDIADNYAKKATELNELLKVKTIVNKWLSFIENTISKGR